MKQRNRSTSTWLFLTVFLRCVQGNCVVCTCAYALCPCCVGGHVRSKYHAMAGSADPGFAYNCCLHCFLPCCALAQEGRATTKMVMTGMAMIRG